ncbi:MAG: hypothetical protein AB8B74_11915 [Crocinitomicaceae bacterium]
MMSILENISNYFNSKSTGESSDQNPKGTCPTCWGHNEWDGKFYDIVKDEHAKPGHAKYDSFISIVVNEHVSKTHNLKDKYICTNCNSEIPT